MNNPYGVGDSREKGDLRTGTCPCCKVEFKDSAPYPKYPGRCPQCQLHDPSTDAGNIRMLRDHADWYLTIQRRARRFAGEKVEECRAMGERMVAALRSRDRWERIVETIEESHIQNYPGGPCVCGRSNCDIPEIVRRAEKEAYRQALIRDHDYMGDWEEQWERHRKYAERSHRDARE